MLKKEKKNTDVARKQSVVNLNQQAFGRKKTVVMSGPLDEPPRITTTVTTENRFMNRAGLKQTNNKFVMDAIEEARRASLRTPDSDFKVDISSLYVPDSEPVDETIVRSANEVASSSDDSFSDHSSDTSSGDEDASVENPSP
jgi:hypothetical protein